MSRPAWKAVLSEAVVTGGEALGGKYGGAAACKAVPRHQLRHNKVLSSRQFSYCLRPGTVSRVTTASLSIALQAIPLTPFSNTYLALGAPSLYFFYDNRDNGKQHLSGTSVCACCFRCPCFFLLSLKIPLLSLKSEKQLCRVRKQTINHPIIVSPCRSRSS